MSTATQLKPWDSLGDLGKREEIARRLYAPGEVIPVTVPKGMHIKDCLPDWPTNDGLAFTEVWPKIPSDYAIGYNQANGEKQVFDRIHSTRAFMSDTWADAICRAAYELLEPANGEIGYHQSKPREKWEGIARGERYKPNG